MGFLVHNKLRSTSVRSYISAIKSVLLEIGVKLQEDSFLLTSLTKACKYKNESVINRFPICKGMLKLMLDKINKMYGGENPQRYLRNLYLAVLSTAYYGLLWIEEVALSPHVILAHNAHVGTNKNKILFILESSKTHCKSDKLQKVKIASSPIQQQMFTPGKRMQYSEKYCPFALLKNFIGL